MKHTDFQKAIIKWLAQERAGVVKTLKDLEALVTGIQPVQLRFEMKFEKNFFETKFETKFEATTRRRPLALSKGLPAGAQYTSEQKCISGAET